MSHNFGKKLPTANHSFGKKLSHGHNAFNKMHNSIKHFNHSAIPMLGVASAMGMANAVPIGALLKGGEALTGLMSGQHRTPSNVTFDGQAGDYAKHRRPMLER